MKNWLRVLAFTRVMAELVLLSQDAIVSKTFGRKSRVQSGSEQEELQGHQGRGSPSMGGSGAPPDP